MGRTNPLVSRAEWLRQSWADLRLAEQQPNGLTAWSIGSKKRFKFICRCGRESIKAFREVASGNTKSCGKCKVQDWRKHRWGKLAIAPAAELPTDLTAGSERLVDFRCDCGNTKSIIFYSVTSGRTTSCGSCRAKSKSAWLAESPWGNLTLLDHDLPAVWTPMSHRELPFRCAVCGREARIPFCKVMSGHSRTCGHCTDMPKTYWLAQEWSRLRLMDNPSLPAEWGPRSNQKMRFSCNCGREIECGFDWVASGNTRSCGCAKMGQTELSPAHEIYSYVLPLAPDAVYNYKFRIEAGRREYDIYIPSRRLAIEYHELIWHSERFNAGTRDYRKYLEAIALGDRLIQIYGDEWRLKRSIIENYLFAVLAGKSRAQRITPVYAVERNVSGLTTNFLNQYHYLGASPGCLAVRALHKDQTVGTWLFQQRFRERSVGTVLWHRACWDHRYRAWNPHARALSLALPELRQMGFSRLLSFSDNRFHEGQLYQKLGFQLEATIPPTYTYTDGTVRKARYSFRFPSGINVTEEAAKLGWHRLWDSGKRRWALSF